MRKVVDLQNNLGFIQKPRLVIQAINSIIGQIHAGNSVHLVDNSQV